LDGKQLSRHDQTYAAFGDELTKIAFLDKAWKATKGFARKGWDDMGGIAPGEKGRGNGWLGKQVNKDGTKSWRRNLPVGGKSIAAGLTAGFAPSTLGPRVDPLGQERTRTERAVDMGGEIGGSVVGAGAALSLPGKKFKLLKSIGGAVGGGLLASRVATTPWRAGRERAKRPVLSADERQNLMRQTMGRYQ